MIENTKVLGRIVYNNVFTKEECAKILSSAVNSNEAYISDKVVNHDIRKTITKEIPLNNDNTWIFNRIFNIVKKVNHKYYNFDIKYLGEVHVLEYQKDHFYDWHIDLGSSIATCSRKISAVVFLSDRNDYEGGELDWITPSSVVEDTFSPSQEQGSMILFPSFMFHKVKPVTKGVRHTLVTWTHGDTFR